MTVILAFMAVAITTSLFVAHLAAKLAERILTPPRDSELTARLAKDRAYSKIL
jgi:hypothetical protein